jgi:SpoIVB peptidase S55
MLYPDRACYNHCLKDRVLFMRPLILGLALAAPIAAGLWASPAQTSPFFPVSDLEPGMVGVGRTVFNGDALEEFRATIIGVLHNAIGPRRDLILARLEGGPLATTGVIRGMSGSPVYIDGRLVGAVSYALGSFPKEPLAGITPIAEMTDAVNLSGPRVTDRALAIEWPAPATEVFAALGRLATRAASPLGRLTDDLRIVGPPSLADLAPALRPIGAAMVFNGFEPGVDRDLRRAMSIGGSAGQAPPRTARTIDATGLRPGDPVGMSLVHGDLEMGATGTVTHVDNGRVYAFGHPFLNLGPTAFPMTKARVFTVVPSLESSMKIATLGPVIGTMSQDRATAVGGTLGAGPRELEINVVLTSERAPSRRFAFSVLRDQVLTPLFTYVALLSALSSYERETGAMTVAARGSVSFGPAGQVAIDDLFSGDTARTAAAGAVAAPVGAAMVNEFRAVEAEKIEVEFRALEKRETTTIERVWLDTVRPRFGATHQLQVQLQDYRGGKRVIALPVQMPSYAEGPLTLVVSDAPSLTALEQKELRPGKPTTWPDLLTDLNAVKRNNRLYVRLVASSTGTVVGGDTLPALPSSVRSVLDSDATVARGPVTRTVIGSWEQRLDLAVRGYRELTLTLTDR